MCAAATIERDSPATVFVVDDDHEVRKSMQRFLRSFGYDAKTLPSARDFLQQLPITDVSCLILDVQMPELSGIQLQEQLSSAGCRIPIVFLTAHGDIPTSVRAIKGGAEDFLSKMAPKEELLDAVERALGRSREMLEQQEQQRDVLDCAERLTNREREVCSYVITGMLNKQIAAKLGISERTVKAHRAKVMEKFGVRSLAELIQSANLAGIDRAR